jgi:saccharopine dehydrogenase-like NADP-dependent oxidoreductase
MKKVVVLGAGRVGTVMARDLADAGRLDVTVADVRIEALERVDRHLGLEVVKADLSNPAAVRKTVRGFDLAVGAVPGFMGFATLKAVVEAGVDCADISFMPEDPMKLDRIAKSKGVTAVVDCGVAPGLSNMILGYQAAKMDSMQDAIIMVGGLPRVRTWPYEYKAGFSPIDVLEEYTRPARIVVGGTEATVPALSGVELVDLPGVGTLEAFNSDGLRSLISNIKAVNMREMTLRYPGHAERMRMLRESGFFSLDPVDVDGAKVRPIDITTKLLFPIWEMRPGDEDITVMRVTIDGMIGKRHVRHTYDLLDRYDPKRGETSMSRTTGFTNAIVAAMMARREICAPGVVPPEKIGCHETLFKSVLSELEKRGVAITHREERA